MYYILGMSALNDSREGIDSRILPACQEPIAIVGLACRFPAGVSSLDDLRLLLAEKRSAIAEVPADRWDSQAFFHPDF